jgi:hypothetical protein
MLYCVHVKQTNTEAAQMSRSILIEVKSQYGNTVIYPACNNAETFAKLAGTKTLTQHTLELIEQLGYKIDTYTPDWRI